MIRELSETPYHTYRGRVFFNGGWSDFMDTEAPSEGKAKINLMAKLAHKMNVSYTKVFNDVQQDQSKRIELKQIG